MEGDRAGRGCEGRALASKSTPNVWRVLISWSGARVSSLSSGGVESRHGADRLQACRDGSQTVFHGQAPIMAQGGKACSRKPTAPTALPGGAAAPPASARRSPASTLAPAAGAGAGRGEGRLGPATAWWPSRTSPSTSTPGSLHAGDGGSARPLHQADARAPNVLELRREPDEKATKFRGRLGTPTGASRICPRPPPAALGGGAPGRRRHPVLRLRAGLRGACRRPCKGCWPPFRPSTRRRGPTARKAPSPRRPPSAPCRSSRPWRPRRPAPNPLVRTHPVTGRKALFISPVYTVGVEGLTGSESDALLGFLFKHMVRDEFVYRHRWKAGMLLDVGQPLHHAPGRRRL